jgi:hypothetical protein
MKHIRLYEEGFEGDARQSFAALLAGLQSDRTPIAKLKTAGKAAYFRCLDGSPPRNLVNAEIVQRDDVAWLEARREGLLDVSKEGIAGYRAIDDSRCAIAALDRLSIVFAKA